MGRLTESLNKALNNIPDLSRSKEYCVIKVECTISQAITISEQLNPSKNELYENPGVITGELMNKNTLMESKSGAGEFLFKINAIGNQRERAAISVIRQLYRRGIDATLEE